jgi:hypothetical protein
MRPFLKCLLTAAFFWPWLAQAQVIGLSVPETTAVKGTTMWLPIRADSSLSGRNVTSFELQFSIYSSVIQPDSVAVTGSLLDGLGWNVFMSRPVPDVVRIAAAGTTPLSGTGPLLFVRVPLNAVGWTPFSFVGSGASLLNEGDPAVSFANGWIQITDPPSIDVYPDGDILAVGDRRQFSMWGGTPPVVWSTSDPGVASIDADGILTALAPGSVRVMAQDAEGVQGASENLFVVRAIGIGVPDTSVPATRIVDVPVSVSSLTPWHVTAGSIRLTYNADVLTPLSVVTAGSLLEATGPVVNLTQPGQVALSFATDQPIVGQGALFFVRFQTIATASWSELNFVEAMFNEDLPARTDNGSVSVVQPTTISIDDGGAKVLVGDTLWLQAWGGEGTYVWSSSDSTVARVDGSGRLVGLRSGRVRVTVRDAGDGFGQTPEIDVFDGAVQMPAVLGAAGGWVDVPVSLPRLAPGHVVSSYQIRIIFNPDILSFASVTTAGTVTETWATTHHADSHRLTVAGATAGGLNGPGTLFVVRFAVQTSAQLRWESTVEFEQALMNEGAPRVDAWNGRVRVALPPGVVTLWSPGDGWTDQPLAIEFSWSSVEFAQRYEIQVATDTAFADIFAADSSLTINNLVVGPLENSTTYFWRVRASNTLGSGPWSEVRRVTTVLAPPPTPMLALPPDGILDLPVTPTLVWHPAEHAASYTVQISEDSTFEVDVRTVGEISDTLHFVSPLDHARRYFWRVRAVNSSGWSEWSAAWAFRTIVAPAGTPFLSEPSSGLVDVSTSPTFRWWPATDAASYRLQLAKDSEFMTLVVDSSGIVDTLLSVSGLDHLETYFWRVRASNASGEGLWSDVWSFETIAGSPTTPVLALPVNGAVGLPLLMPLVWYRSPMAVAYDIQLAEDSGFTSIVMNATSIPDTNYPIGALQPLKTYYWRVRALNTVDTSSYSDAWSFTTTTSDAAGADWGGAPDRFGLDLNYPNPFNPTTQITFHLQRASRVTLTVYTLTGIEVERILDASLSAGTYATTWDAGARPSGVYLCRMTAGSFTAVRRLVLLK